jgi:hypothetical protein
MKVILMMCFDRFVMKVEVIEDVVRKELIALEAVAITEG